MRRLILALDQGTSSSRAILFDLRGTPVASAQQEFPQHFPQPGWVEHEPSDIWQSQRATAMEAMREAGVSPEEILAVGITNQRETVMLWDRATGAPVGRAIVWQDRRTAAALEAMRASGRIAAPVDASGACATGAEERVKAVTGLLLDPYFSASKLAWLLDNTPGARKRAERGELAAGTVDAWLLWNLTERRCHETDVSNASRTMLMDLRTLDWSEEMLALFGIPRAVLPRITPCAGEGIDLAARAASALGLRCPVAASIGDQQAALLGQSCLEEGAAKNTYGTGCFLLLNTGAQPRAADRLLSTVAWRLCGSTHYALEGSVFVAGSAIQWLRDGLRLIGQSAEIGPLAATVPDTAGVEFVPAFAGLGAPWWDPHARGALLGLTRGTSTAHVARATIESIALQVADLVEAMESGTGARMEVLRADGGAAACDLLMQVQADLLGVPVERARVLETTALGAASAAALGVGAVDGPHALASLREVERVFEPARDAAWRAARRATWRKAVERSLGWAKEGA